VFYFAFVGYYLENYNREKLIENDQHHNISNKSMPLNNPQKLGREPSKEHPCQV
jgi:hypothetical protein